MSKKFRVQFREWYYDDKEKKNFSRFLDSFIFSQEKGQKKQ